MTAAKFQAVVAAKSKLVVSVVSGETTMATSIVSTVLADNIARMINGQPLMVCSKCLLKPAIISDLASGKTVCMECKPNEH